MTAFNKLLSKAEKEYSLLKLLLGNNIPKYVIIMLMIINIIFYSNRVNELITIRRNIDTYIPLLQSVNRVNDDYIKKNSSKEHESPLKKCKSNFDSFCMHGDCRYAEDLDEVVCLCSKGYSGRRCEIFGLSTI